MSWLFWLLVGCLLGMGAGFSFGGKVGWHRAASECLHAFASTLKTMETAAHTWQGEDYTGAHHVPMGVINSLAGEYREELKARGIWRGEQTR